MSEHTPSAGTHRKLVRRTDEGMIAGVAAGVAHFLGVDPTVVRLGFVALSFFGGSGLLLYLVMWVIVPKPDQVTAPPRQVARNTVDDMVAEARRAAGSVKDAVKGGRGERSD